MMTRDEIIKILDRAMQRYVEQNQQLFLRRGKTDKGMWEELEAINNARYILSRLPQVVNCPDCGRMYDTDYLHFCRGDKCVIGGDNDENGNV